MKKIILTVLVLMFYTNNSLLADGYSCLVAPYKNVGYCAEGVDNKGKCVKIKIGDAYRCSADGIGLSPI